MLRAYPDNGALQSGRGGWFSPRTGQNGVSAVPSPQVHQGGRSCGGSRKCHQRNGDGLRHGGGAAPILPGSART
eukprot:12935128-Heterocapsa_arctica.AAC.1